MGRRFAMNLVKRRNDSTRPLARLRDEMDDLFGRFFDDWDIPGLAPMRGGWLPSMEISEQEDKILVKAELPGVTSKDIDVSVRNNVLTITGEKKEQTEDKGEGYYRSERRYGSFRRDIQLPSGIDEGKVEAACKDGVLTVTLPKSEQAKARRIEVKN
ncbi:MAG: Hsp20/alpha crystallin family protein [Phycisphaerae bacterium]|nr:Hsp20/alpha crystallin family protein [Phycisphaerae bacterium]